MATRGFEFAYNLDGSGLTPLIKDWPMVADAAGYAQGDVLTVDSNGRADKITANLAEVLAICQETKASAVANDDLLKIAIVTRNQVWRCSMDDSSTNAKAGYTKTIDVADENTIDADDLTNGQMILVDTDVDDDGNVIAYVVFADTTFGNG